MKKKKKHCKTIILCGGKGTRLGKLGKTIPKTLVELNQKPLIHHKIEHSAKQGFNDFIIAIGYKGNMIIDALKKIDIDIVIDYSDSGEEAGMLRRIFDARHLFEKRAVITYGDSISNLKLDKLLAFHIKKKSLLSIVTAPIQSPFGLVTSDHTARALTLEEKPVLRYYIGTFIIEKKAFEFLPKEIINWPDGTGLIAFFKILMGIDSLYTYSHEGTDLTFNTLEELNAAKEGFIKFHTHFQS